MTITPKYPSHLLQASDNLRLKYFVDDVIVDHPSLDQSMEALDELANPFLEKRLILLLGGSGVGKTALMKKLVKKRIARRAAAIAANQQVVPAVFYEVEAPDKGKFSFLSLYRGGLAEINAALIERTLPITERQTRDRSMLTISVEHAGRRVDASALKARFIKNLIDREIELACLDEAINIFKVGKHKSERDRKEQLKEQADKLKTFGNKTPTTLVLAGAYDFFDLTLVSGQIARRSSIVHMEPYTMTKEGLEGFVAALVGLLSHLPIEHGLDPGKYATELFLQSLGCIGILKNILSNALLKALSRKSALTIDLVRGCFFTAAQLDVMRQEMELGIAKVRELMTMEQLVQKAELVETNEGGSSVIKSKKLAPGETTPSHRHAAAKVWGSD